MTLLPREHSENRITRAESDARLHESVDVAKARLLSWGEQTDAAVHDEMQHLRTQLKKLTPWALGTGLLFGILGGKRRRRERAALALGKPAPKPSGFGRALGITFDLMPFVFGLVSRFLVKRF